MFCPGQVVVKQREPCPYCCIIVEGSVQVSKAKQGILGNMKSGQWFGDLRSPTAMANVMTTENTVFALFTKEHIDAVMSHRHAALVPAMSSRCLLPEPSNTHEANQSRESINLILDELTFFERNLGRGTFGTVYPCMDAAGNMHAVKCICKDTVVRHQAQKQTETEIRLLTGMYTPFIVRLHCTMQDERCVFLVMEMVPGGEFFKFLVAKGTLKEADCLFYTANVICGLRHMHELDIVFRDLKPENLVFGSRGFLKVVDFGF